MCKIEKLKRDAGDNSNRSLKTAKDTIVLHEDSKSGKALLYTGVRTTQNKEGKQDNRGKFY